MDSYQVFETCVWIVFQLPAFCILINIICPNIEFVMHEIAGSLKSADQNGGMDSVLKITIGHFATNISIRPTKIILIGHKFFIEATV